MGNIPHLSEKFGGSFAKDTKRALNEAPEEHVRVAMRPQRRDEHIPGYAAHVPNHQNAHGKSFTATTREALDEYRLVVEAARREGQHPRAEQPVSYMLQAQNEVRSTTSEQARISEVDRIDKERFPLKESVKTGAVAITPGYTGSMGGFRDIPDFNRSFGKAANRWVSEVKPKTRASSAAPRMSSPQSTAKVGLQQRRTPTPSAAKDPNTGKIPPHLISRPISAASTQRAIKGYDKPDRRKWNEYIPEAEPLKAISGYTGKLRVGEAEHFGEGFGKAVRGHSAGMIPSHLDVSKATQRPNHRIAGYAGHVPEIHEQVGVSAIESTKKAIIGRKLRAHEKTQEERTRVVERYGRAHIPEDRVVGYSGHMTGVVQRFGEPTGRIQRTTMSPTKQR